VLPFLFPGYAQVAMGAVLSVLTLAVMYAFNDLYDARGDLHNPKKDQRVVGIYLQNERLCYGLLLALKVLVMALAFVVAGPAVGGMVAAVLLINLVYSTVMKGLPVVDVVWCGIWGAAYVGIVTPPLHLLGLVALMTAVCHLYQALGDVSADAENRITTTAVFSHQLSAGVLFVLTSFMFLVLREPLGTVPALSAFVPFALFFIARSSYSAWVLTKVYFGVIWLIVLRHAHAGG
jgi:4-hydroxybenzoate polyprenyltransferase